MKKLFTLLIVTIVILMSSVCKADNAHWVVENGYVILKWEVGISQTDNGFFINRNGSCVYISPNFGNDHSYTFVDIGLDYGLYLYELFSLDSINNSTHLITFKINYTGKDDLGEYVNLTNTSTIEFEDAYLSKFITFPNPVNSIININLYSNVEVQLPITLYNISGRVMKQYNMYNIRFGKNIIKLDVNDISTGIYIVTIGNLLRNKITILK